MKTHDEHDDDLEPQVNEGAEIETENYRPGEDEDLQENEPLRDIANPAGGTSEPDANAERAPEIERESNDTL